MAKGYSKDLRVRAVSMVEDGESAREVARVLKIGASTAIRWIARWTTTGSVEAKPGTGHCRSPLNKHEQWLLDLIEPQGSDERQRLPVTVWHAGDQPLTARTAAIVTDHFRRDRGLVNEHQARRLERRLLSFERCARSRNIRPILLGGVQSFF